ncbi:MAG TPA: dTDP-glucose 4,6-dehydratase [Steroidobacteraceae bacterium]
MSFEPHNVCITGGAGFIGANFVRHWLNRSREGRVVVFDALTYAGNPDNLAGLDRDPRYVFVRGDICDEDAVRELLERHAIDTIVHFAAESHVDRSILGPDDFIRTNIVGTHALLKAARALWLDKKIVAGHRFHHVSTDEVYGSLGPNDAPFNESTPYAPNSPYSASKAASDHLVRAYHETYGLDTTVTNCSNNYGPYQFPEKLIPLTLINILLGKPLPVYGDGLQVRDWLHVADHCEAIVRALTRGRPGEVYNIGGNAETANIQVVRALCALTDEVLSESADLRAAFAASPSSRGGRSVDLITYVRDRPGHDRRYAIDYRKAGLELEYSPTRNLQTGLRETMEWYLSNRTWWEALLGRDYAAWMRKNYEHTASP